MPSKKDCQWVSMVLYRHRDVQLGRKRDRKVYYKTTVERAMAKVTPFTICLPPTAKTLFATGQYLARTNHSWPVCATLPMVSPPACVLGCGRESLFCRRSSTPPKNYTFLGRLLVSQSAANIAQRYADQTRCRSSSHLNRDSSPVRFSTVSNGHSGDPLLRDRKVYYKTTTNGGKR